MSSGGRFQQLLRVKRQHTCAKVCGTCNNLNYAIKIGVNVGKNTKPSFVQFAVRLYIVQIGFVKLTLAVAATRSLSNFITKIENNLPLFFYFSPTFVSLCITSLSKTKRESERE